MRIVSLNVNGFCGLADKRGYSFGGSGNSFEENSMEHAGKVCEAILKERADVVFLSEFDVCSAAGQEAIRRMKDGGYSPVFPNRWSFISPGYTSIVVAFVKGACSREKSPGNWLQWNEMLLQGYRLIGLHITRDSMWEDILAAYERHREEKVVFIGDFNVSHRETYGKQKMEDLMKRGRSTPLPPVMGRKRTGRPVIPMFIPDGMAEKGIPELITHCCRPLRWTVWSQWKTDRALTKPVCPTMRLWRSN